MQPEKQPSRVVELFREQPLLFVSIALVLIIFCLIFIFGHRAGGPKNDGDLPGEDSGAFLVYKKESYFPLNNSIADNLLRDDIAYFARQTFGSTYQDSKRVAVVFNVSKQSTNKTNGEITFSGKFDKVKDSVTVTVSKQSNDRIKTHIENTSKKTNIDDKLPSKNKLNSFIATLPYQADNYYIEYLESDGSINTIIGEKNSAYLTAAQDFIKQQTGISDLSTIKLSYIYPTNVDYGDTLNQVEELPPKNLDY